MQGPVLRVTALFRQWCLSFRSRESRRNIKCWFGLRVPRDKVWRIHTLRKRSSHSIYFQASSWATHCHESSTHPSRPISKRIGHYRVTVPSECFLNSYIRSKFVPLYTPCLTGKCIWAIHAYNLYIYWAIGDPNPFACAVERVSTINLLDKLLWKFKPRLDRTLKWHRVPTNRDWVNLQHQTSNKKSATHTTPPLVNSPSKRILSPFASVAWEMVNTCSIEATAMNMVLSAK